MEKVFHTVDAQDTPSLISEVSGGRLQPGHRWYPFRQVMSPGNELLHNIAVSLEIPLSPLLIMAKQIHDGLSPGGRSLEGGE